MNRFTTGAVAGGILAAVSVGWLMSDGKTRKRVVRDSKKKLRKAGDFFDGVTDMFD